MYKLIKVEKRQKVQILQHHLHHLGPSSKKAPSGLQQIDRRDHRAANSVGEPVDPEIETKTQTMLQKKEIIESSHHNFHECAKKK